jgi:hypothetical protein
LASLALTLDATGRLSGADYEGVNRVTLPYEAVA